MFRKYMLAGAALALIAGPAMATSALADQPFHRQNERYYIVQDPGGACFVTLSRHDKVLGEFNSRSAADRALAIESSC